MRFAVLKHISELETLARKACVGCSDPVIYASPPTQTKPALCVNDSFPGFNQQESF